MQNVGELASQSGKNWLQVISFIGILITIAISYSSLNQQRNASARESLEQLDDVRLHESGIKMRPLLYSYKSWPQNHSTVKIKMYNSTETSGVSRMYPKFCGFPSQVLKDYPIEVQRDGYLLDIDSANPVIIRRNTDEFLQALYSESRVRGWGNIPSKDLFMDQYGDALDGDLLPLHDEILDTFEPPSRERSLQGITDALNVKYDFHKHIIKLAIADLILIGELEKTGRRKYQLAN